MAADGRSYVRHGIGAARPYLYGYIGMEELLKHAFGAKEIEKLNSGPSGYHIELRIGDSILVLETGEAFPGDQPKFSSVYVYVEDVDAVYQRAIEAGAISLGEPEDKPYNERAGAFRDGFGNTWYVSTFAG